MAIIALDAMGGDNAPLVVVQGALKAASKGFPIKLFGNRKDIVKIAEAEMPGMLAQLPIEITDSFDDIDMAETSVRRMLMQKKSSIACGIDALKNGSVDAFISAGNSAAVYAFATLHIGRIDGLMKPALGSFIPTQHNKKFFCLDLGANTDCKPDYLLQFAHMGSVYVKIITGLEYPRVGLLSN
jgi:glycerol-3-phosphate acyltransferase PlsX